MDVLTTQDDTQLRLDASGALAAPNIHWLDVPSLPISSEAGLEL
jgi:hypothetical protein